MTLSLILLSALAAPPQDMAAAARRAQQAGDFRRAAALYTQLAGDYPDHAELLSNAGVMFYMAGEDRTAADRLLQALRLKPELAAANLFEGLALTRLGQARNALPYLERAWRADANAPLPALALARAHLALGEFRRANDYYDAAAQRDPRSAEAWFGLGVTYRRLLDAAAARLAQGGHDRELATLAASGAATRSDMAAAEKGLARQPADAKLQARAAACYRDLALEALTRAVALDPNSEQARLLLAEADRDKDLSAAVQEYQAVIRMHPDSPSAYFGLAVTYWRSGDLDSAGGPLRQALALAPSDPEANELMADLLVRRGQYADAKRFADRALRGNPRLVRVWWALGKIDLAENRPARAVEELRKALPADADGSYYYALHQALQRLGRTEEAAAALAQFRERRARVRGRR